MSNTNASNNNSFAAQLLAILATGMEKELSATADWAEFASQMETQNGVNKVTARTEYELNNELSNVWSALYGNTTDTQFIPDRNTELDQRTRFCARLNVQYWQQRIDTYRSQNPHIDPAAPEFNEIEATNDLDYANILVSYNEAILNYNRLLAKFTWRKEAYEFMTDSAWGYKPYTVQQKKVHPANAGLAAKIIKDMVARAA
jgi:hypothetical protein